MLNTVLYQLVQSVFLFRHMCWYRKSTLFHIGLNTGCLSAFQTVFSILAAMHVLGQNSAMWTLALSSHSCRALYLSALDASFLPQFAILVVPKSQPVSPHESWPHSSLILSFSLSPSQVLSLTSASSFCLSLSQSLPHKCFSRSVSPSLNLASCTVFLSLLVSLPRDYYALRLCLDSEMN